MERKTKMENRTVKVIGKSLLPVPMDSVCVRIDCEKRGMDYEEVMEAARTSTLLMEETVKKLHIDEKNLNTTQYSVTPEFTTVKEENGTYKRIPAGYLGKTGFKVNLILNGIRLAQLLKEVSAFSSSIHLLYFVKDPTFYEDKAIKLATEDAIEKAKIIAFSSNIKLGRILSIEYGRQDSRNNGMDAVPMMLSARSANDSIDIRPEDMEIQEEVFVEFEIL